MLIRPLKSEWHGRPSAPSPARPVWLLPSPSSHRSDARQCRAASIHVCEAPLVAQIPRAFGPVITGRAESPSLPLNPKLKVQKGASGFPLHPETAPSPQPLHLLRPTPCYSLHVWNIISSITSMLPEPMNNFLLRILFSLTVALDLFSPFVSLKHSLLLASPDAAFRFSSHLSRHLPVCFLGSSPPPSHDVSAFLKAQAQVLLPSHPNSLRMSFFYTYGFGHSH